MRRACGHCGRRVERGIPLMTSHFMVIRKSLLIEENDWFVFLLSFSIFADSFLFRCHLSRQQRYVNSLPVNHGLHLSLSSPIQLLFSLSLSVSFDLFRFFSVTDWMEISYVRRIRRMMVCESHILDVMHSCFLPLGSETKRKSREMWIC
jgi:hypothetical protein